MTFPAPRGTAPLAVAALLALPVLAGAQWLKYKTPGIPRTADGKPDLSAPAPRTTDGKPDFSSVWQNDNARAAQTSRAKESMKPQPWGGGIVQEAHGRAGKRLFRHHVPPARPHGRAWRESCDSGAQSPGDALRRHSLPRGLPGWPPAARKSSIPIGWGIR
jgi:hypothetical protein